MNAKCTELDSCLDSDLDLVEELKLRTWARQNYVPANQRSAEWHPVVLQEMSQRDAEVPPRPSDSEIPSYPEISAQRSPVNAPKSLKRFRLNALVAQLRRS